ncbi:MAG: polysaccharide deacetylase family protein [Methylococcales bacterium]|nr:polysaccharide deacetylase family protein [Methylococcales bacterium]
MNRIFLLVSCCLINNYTYADTTTDTELIFNWAESKFPTIFSIPSLTKETNQAKSSGELAGTVRYREYPGEIYAGVVNGSSVYVIGGSWTSLTYVDSLANLVNQISAGSDPKTFKANAGLDQNLLDRENDGFENIVLDARGSSIRGYEEVAYRWSEGPKILSEKAIMTTKLALGNHTIKLEIIENDDNISVDSVDIHIEKNLGNLQRLNLPFQPSTTRFTKSLEKNWPENDGEASICLWEKDKFAAASITIDDNVPVDHDWWINIGNIYNWKFTWFVIVDSLYNNTNKVSTGSWSEFQKLANVGHDIQSHSMTHQAHDDTRENDEVIIEYLDAFNLINSNITNNKAYTIAWPWGVFNREIGSLFSIAGRGTASTPNKPENIDYLNVNSLTGGINDAYLDSILQGTSTVSWLGNNQYKRGWLVSTYHFVKDRDAVASELNHLHKRSNDLWLGLFKDVARYGQERDTARLSIITNNPTKIEFKLWDEMDDQIFNYPLTIKIKMHSGWQKIIATQAGNNLESGIIYHNDVAYALIKAIPDKGNVVIKPL